MKNRSVIEIMVLVFTGVVGFSLVATGATIAIVEIRHPESDTSSVVQAMLSIISGILGALLGLIAGKSDSRSQGPLSTRPSDRDPSELTDREPQ